MPMLAEIDDPPRARWRGMLIGAVLALPLVGAVVIWLLPSLVAAVLGGAEDLDARLRAEDAYVRELCSTAMALPRDEALCGCAAGVEYPSLDCQIQFRQWTLARFADGCREPRVHETAVSFCVCVETVAEANTDPETDINADAALARCQALTDALPLPPVETLAPAS